MTTTDLGACELFISELRRSGLIERGQLEPLLEDFARRSPTNDVDSLAEFLISQGFLTRFQADRVITGKTQGLVLGPYVLCDAIGSGSMGSVHKAMSKNDGSHYAVKVLPRRSMWNVRLARRQVRAFGTFNHPAVVPFVDVGTAGGLHYLVWNFVEGETLESLVQRLGRVDAATTAQIGQQLAAGLGVAHANGLFHGLLKPSNIMLSPGGQVRILDFGIGSLLAENEGESLVDTMSTANTLTSGLDCASPESIMEPTNRTPAGDQYSLGCTLYYCLTGRYPFAEGSAVEKMMAHQFKQAQPVTDHAPETPHELAGVIDRLMQKKPDERYKGVHDALEALAPLAPPSPTPTLLHGPTQALTQTPMPGQTKSGMAPTRAVTPAPPVSSLVNPDLVPRSQGGAWATGTGSSAARSHSGSIHLTKPPSGDLLRPPSEIKRPPSGELMRPPSGEMPRPVMPVQPAMTPAPLPPTPSMHLPTRRSIRGESAPQTVHKSGSHVPLARPSPEAVRTSMNLQNFAQPWIQPEEPPKSRINIGPLGLLALGATVALTCFILVNHFLK